MFVENKNTDPSCVNRVHELYTDDTVVALNAALLDRGIKAEQIISVLAVPGQGMGVPVAPRFRVLYRPN